MKSFAFLLLLGLAFVSPLAKAADDVPSLLTRADALDAQLNTGKALETLLAAEKLAPNDAEVLWRIAKQYGLSMSDTTDEVEKKKRGEVALGYAKRAIAANPSNAMAQLSMAVCYGRLAPLLDNKTGLAYSKMVKEYAEKSRQLDPNNDLSYYILGAWNLELASLGAVKRALARVLYGQLPPASFEEAARNLQKASQLNPARMANVVELGRTYAAMGKKQEAKQTLTRSLAMPLRDKDDPEVKARAQKALRDL